MADAKKLSKERIFHPPLTVHLPGLNNVDHRAAVSIYVDRAGFVAPEFGKLVQRLLNVALLVRASGLEHSLLSVPRPVQEKTGKGSSVHWILKPGLPPSLTAVGGHF